MYKFFEQFHSSIEQVREFCHCFQKRVFSVIERGWPIVVPEHQNYRCNSFRMDATSSLLFRYMKNYLLQQLLSVMIASEAIQTKEELNKTVIVKGIRNPTHNFPNHRSDDQ
jgi:hypothetical protein